ncbi:apoptosis inhibitor 5 [Copidosoma floridanum]|uniref:apoptosis inhibitor 5 n=1 Tax=Copidosoma floridanum TaxID=29053 RepID=UPI0006C9B503|nr:apoptosis inhibitor 5 [Copidosoma floridanum]
MTQDSIEKLYINFGVLAEAKDKLQEHEKEYLEILKAVKGSAKEKRLASQFIARFFKHFPNLAEKAIDAHLDLCEDEDISIRKQAVKDLPLLCKDNKEHSAKIADILAQLLVVKDSSELDVVHNSIMTVIKNDPKGAIRGIFSQILNSAEDNGGDVVREHCIKYLSTKLKALGRDVITKDVEDVLIAECKKVLQDVTAEEFHSIMEMLSWTRLGSTVNGQKELVEITIEQAQLSVPFKHTDLEQCSRLIQCIKHALPYFSSQVESTKFVSYISMQVLPHLSLITSPDKSDVQLELLKLLAELSEYCGKIEKPEEKIQQLYNALITFMPLPPATEIAETPKLQFSHVECLMYAFHKLCKQTPEFLIKDADQLKEFRLRLQYFARGIQGYIKKLREAINGKSEEELKTKENQIKVIALKTTNNINTLIKDLFHTPPSFKSVIHPSWKTIVSKEKKSDKITIGQKRHTPITFGNGNSITSSNSNNSNNHASNKRMKVDSVRNNKIYTPPSGKYSSNISSNYGNNRGRFQNNQRYNNNNGRVNSGRGTGGGGFRPRGRGSWRKNSY